MRRYNNLTYSYIYLIIPLSSQFLNNVFVGNYLLYNVTFVSHQKLILRLLFIEIYQFLMDFFDWILISIEIHCQLSHQLVALTVGLNYLKGLLQLK